MSQEGEGKLRRHTSSRAKPPRPEKKKPLSRNHHHLKLGLKKGNVFFQNGILYTAAEHEHKGSVSVRPYGTENGPAVVVRINDTTRFLTSEEKASLGLITDRTD